MLEMGSPVLAIGRSKRNSLSRMWPVRAGGTGKWRRDAVFMSRLDSPVPLKSVVNIGKVMVDCVGECCVRWG